MIGVREYQLPFAHGAFSCWRGVSRVYGVVYRAIMDQSSQRCSATGVISMVLLKFRATYSDLSVVWLRECGLYAEPAQCAVASAQC